MLLASCFLLLLSVALETGKWKVFGAQCMYSTTDGEGDSRSVDYRSRDAHPSTLLRRTPAGRWLLAAVGYFMVLCCGFPHSCCSLCSLLCVLCVLVCSWTVARSVLRKAAKTDGLGRMAHKSQVKAEVEASCLCRRSGMMK